MNTSETTERAARCSASISRNMWKTLDTVAGFYDERQVGDSGSLGFRRSSELKKILHCLEWLVSRHILLPGNTRFLDMGCADGRVNVFFSYLVCRSVGVEKDDWILDDYSSLKQELDLELSRKGLTAVPRNIHLLEGDSTQDDLHNRIADATGLAFEDFDLFYTYLTMQEEFAALIAQKAKPGAIFAVYGLNRIQPRFPGLELLTPGRALNDTLALYRKV